MYLINEKYQIENVIECWFNQYPNDFKNKGKKLKECSNLTKEKIDNIIGNES